MLFKTLIQQENKVRVVRYKRDLKYRVVGSDTAPPPHHHPTDKPVIQEVNIKVKHHQRSSENIQKKSYESRW